MDPTSYQHMVTLGRIDYMNVAPIYHGIDSCLAKGNHEGIRMICGPPNTLNRMMRDADLDISPVSSAAYARNADDWLILPNLAIASHERVLSVLLVSRYHLDALNGRRILLTDESSSGRDLCRLIFYMKGIYPEFVVGRVRVPSELPTDIDGALVIGDSALSQPWSRFFPNTYDLGALWWHMTGLPFVFAVWAVRKDFAQSHPQRAKAVLSLLKTSRRSGYANMNEIVQKASIRLGIDTAIARQYYQSLVYDLNDREIQGLSLFFQGLYHTGVINTVVSLSFFAEPTSRSAEPVPFPYSDTVISCINRETMARHMMQ